MAPQDLNDNQGFASLFGAMVISAISAAISITQRMLRGYPTSALWLFSESMSAILAGFLAWDMYPHMAESLPAWVSQPLIIAASAHFGGRLFQTLEKHFTKTTGIELAKDQKPIRKPKNTEAKTNPEKE